LIEKKLSNWLLAAALLILIAPVALYMALYGRLFSGSPLPADDFTKLVTSRMREYALIDYANRYLPADSIVLAYRQNDYVFYGRHRIVRDLDPAMIPVYEAKDVEEAWLRMRAMGITHVFVPGYQTPTFSDTVIKSVLSNPEIAQIVLANGQAAIFELAKMKSRTALKKEVIVSDKERWSVVPTDGVRRDVFLKASVSLSDGKAPSKPAWVYSGAGELDVAPVRAPKLRRGYTYIAHGQFHGKGWASVQLITYPKYGVVQSEEIWAAAFDGRAGNLERQIAYREQTEPFRILVKLYCERPCGIAGLSMEEVQEEIAYGGVRLSAGGDAGYTQWSYDAGGQPNCAKTNAPVIHSNGLCQRVYVGPGHWALPPSRYGMQPDISYGLLPKAYHVELLVKGKGELGLEYVGYATETPPRVAELHRLALASQITHSEGILIVPPKTVEFRMGLSTGNPGGGSGLLYSIYVRLRGKSMPVANRPVDSTAEILSLKWGAMQRGLENPAVISCLAAHAKEDMKPGDPPIYCPGDT
jgi:hypothetical protein